LVNDSKNRSFPTYPVASIDTTGAGDAFIGALVHYLSQGKALEESIDKASGYAALSTTQRGTQKSFADLNTFDKWLSQQSKK